MKALKNKELVKLSSDYYKTYYSGVTLNWKNLSKDVLNVEKAIERIAQIEKAIGIIKGKKILEIGCGFGVFLANSIKKGADCYGIEPDKFAYEGAKIVLKKYGVKKQRIIQGAGEKLPFKDNLFDIVVSVMVLEHAQNPELVVREAARVVKPGGKLYFVAPNYKSFWEGHYGVLWFPLFPKMLAKLYVKILGRDARFLNEINYVTPKNVIRMFKKTRKVRIISTGEEIWAERMKNLDFNAWGQTIYLKRKLQFIKDFGLTNLAIRLGKMFEFYYPIIVVAEKKK